MSPADYMSNGFLRDGSTGAVVVRGAADPIGARLLQALENDSRDVGILVIGDSTSNYATGSDTFKWPYLVLSALAARYPRYTVNHTNWTGTFFQAIATTQVGTGTHTLTLYNGSWGGVGPRFHLAQNFDRMMFAPTPLDFDLIFVSHGHNGGAGFTANPSWRDDLLALTESVSLRRPGADIVLVAQNPRTPVPGSDYQEALQHETMRVAQMKGYSFINAWKAMMDASPGGVTVAEPAIGALVISDGVHPNSAGQRVWADAITSRLQYVRGYTPPQQRSSLADTTSARLANGDFAAFAAPPVLTSWTATNATLTKDVTNFESSSGYAVKLTPVAAATSYIEQALGSVREVTGHTLTVSARMFTSAATKATATSGRVSIIEAGGSTPGETLSTASVDGADGYLWITTSRFIAFNATGVSVRVYGDSAAVIGSVVSVDRVTLSRGMLPRDIR